MVLEYPNLILLNMYFCSKNELTSHVYMGGKNTLRKSNGVIQTSPLQSYIWLS